MDRPGREVLERIARCPVDEVFVGARHRARRTDRRARPQVRLARIGPNAIPGSRGPGPARQLLAQMIHLFALMLWVAAILAFVGGMPQLGWAIIAVVIINGVFSFAQEYRAERATQALSALLPEMATVIRDGRRSSILAAELVPGDLVLLREGDRISADARVIRSTGLRVDNSTLTGESEALVADPEPIPRPPRGAHRSNEPGLRRARSWPPGSGRVVVASTGVDTLLGGIARLTGEVVARPHTAPRGAGPCGEGDRGLRRGGRVAVLRRLARARHSGARRVPVRDRGDRRVGAGGAVADAHAVARDERLAHGRARRARPTPGGRGDARVDDRDLLRQDGHDHGQPDDGARGRRTRRQAPCVRDGLRPGGRRVWLAGDR